MCKECNNKHDTIRILQKENAELKVCTKLQNEVHEKETKGVCDDYSKLCGKYNEARERIEVLQNSINESQQKRVELMKKFMSMHKKRGYWKKKAVRLMDKEAEKFIK